MTTQGDRRAPVQGSPYSVRENRHPAVTITWDEHLEAWLAYDRKYHCGQIADRIAQRGGFCYEELQEFLGHDPQTWRHR